MLPRITLAAFILVGLAADGRTVPASRTDAVLLLRVTLPNGMLAALRTPNGTPALVAPAGGDAVRLIPHLVGDAVDLAIWTRDPLKDPAGATLLGRLTLARGIPVLFEHELASFEIEWTGTVASGPMGGGVDGPCQVCCITCDGYTVCACLVETRCASCCCPQACACGAPDSCSVVPTSSQ